MLAHSAHLNLCVNTLLKLYILADLLRVQVRHLHRLPVAVLVAHWGTLQVIHLLQDKEALDTGHGPALVIGNLFRHDYGDLVAGVGGE